jgi:hypothetical protein
MRIVLRVIILFILVPVLSFAAGKTKKLQQNGTPSKEETIKFILDKMNNDRFSTRNDQYKWIITEECTFGRVYNSGKKGEEIMYTPLPKIFDFQIRNSKDSNDEVFYYINMHCKNDSNCVYEKDGSYTWRQNDFWFSTQYTAEKVLKALAHLKTLCTGENEDLF